MAVKLSMLLEDIEDIFDDESLYKLIDNSYIDIMDEKRLESYRLKISKIRRYRKLKNKRKNFYHKIYNIDNWRYVI